MIKLFYASGDSFVFGQELETVKFGLTETPQTLFKFTDYKRKHSYTGIMCDKLRIPNYKNSSCPGGSNERMYRVLINDISKALETYKAEEIFVQLGLTHDSRREFCMYNKTLPTTGAAGNDNYYLHIAGWAPPKPTLHNHNYELWEVLTKHFNHDSGHYMYGIMMLLAIQNFLIVNKIPYLITSAMINDYENAVANKYIDQSLLNQVYAKRCLTNPSFMAFTKGKNLPFGPAHHPLEEGHIAWADFLLNYIHDHDITKATDL